MPITEIIFWTTLGILLAFYFSYYLIMQRASKIKNSNVKKKNYHPSVSLVVATYNEEHTILRKLRNIRELDYPKNKLEVLVVDSASTDDTVSVVKDFLNKNGDVLNLRLLVQEKRMGKASALNHAWKYCSGDIVILSDADVLLEKDAVSKMVANFADPTVGAVTGAAIITNSSHSPSTKLEQNYRGIFEILRKGESNLDSTPVFNGPFSAYRRELIENLRSDTVTDDIELAITVRKKGFRTIYDSTAKFYECTPPTMMGRLKQKQRRAQGLVQALLRHSNMLFNPAYGNFGKIILPSEFFMCICSPLILVLLLTTFALSVITGPSVFLKALMVLSVVTGIVFIVLPKFISSLNSLLKPLTLVWTFLDSQLCLLLGMIGLTRKPNYMWEQNTEVRLLARNQSEPISTLRNSLEG